MPILMEAQSHHRRWWRTESASDEGTRDTLMTWPLIVGSLLVLASGIGFATVADDLRHVGEILGVAAVLVVGILLMLAGWTRSASRRFTMFCLAAGVGIGSLAGAASNHIAVGLGGGLVLGGAASVALKEQNR
jgi:hypothetical protein